MSQEQPRRPELQQEAKYGDVFSVQGELAGKGVNPGDAAIMQSAETTMLGKTENGAAAATMQSAASRNERAGLIGHYDLNDDVLLDGEQGISMTEKHIPGQRIITETVGGQVVFPSIYSYILN